MPKILFCRHGSDKPTKGEDVEYRDDPKLYYKAEKDIVRLTKKFVDKYGTPDIIYVSPFRRCLETYDIMKPYFKAHHKLVITSNLGRFFSYDEQKHPECAPETLKYGPHITEEIRDFEARMRAHVKMVHKEAKNNDLVILNITHTLCMKEAASYYNIKLSKWLDFLEYFTVKL